jgi:hypothetical protein
MGITNSKLRKKYRTANNLPADHGAILEMRFANLLSLRKLHGTVFNECLTSQSSGARPRYANRSSFIAIHRLSPTMNE